MLRENQKSLEKYYIISVFSGKFQLPVFKSRPEVENMTMQNFKRFNVFRTFQKYPIFLNGDVRVSTEWAIESN